MKLKGSSADPKCAKVEVDLTHATEGVPRAKRTCCYQSEEECILILERLDSLEARLERVEHFLDFVGHLTEAFECVVCRSVTKKPVTAACCNRVVGCERWVQHWVERNQTCPLCSCNTDLCDLVQLKGLDHVLETAVVAGCRAPNQPGGREANSSTPPPLPRPSWLGSAGHTSRVTLTTAELSDSYLEVTA